jgi:thiamine pyrophosphate-dependent acetolactate synthase large subunit-like protein
MIKLSGGEALMRAMAAERTPFVFGVVGGKLAGFLRAVSEHPGVRYIGARHEGNAAMMASCIYAASGRLGVVVGECGGGGGNLVPGITIANANRLPMLVITSNNQHAASYPTRGMFAEMDTESVFRPITKWNAVVHDGRRIPELMHRALNAAFTGRPGPVHLDVPQDIMRGTFEFADHAFSTDSRAYRPAGGPAPTADQIDAAAELLLRAQRPLLLAGGGVTAAEAAEEFRALASVLDAAAAPTQMGNGSIASDDPRFIGLAWVCGGDALHRACHEADVVLAVGCRFSSWLWNERGTLVNEAAQVIHIDVDPAAIGSPLRATVGICADAKIALTALLAALRSRLPTIPRREWIRELADNYRNYRGSLNAIAAARLTPMHPAALAQAIAAALPAEALVTFDGGHTTFWSNDFTQGTAPRTRFNEPGMSQLGFGLPWAIALKLLHPERPVFNITGDGAFGFTLQELDTARRLRLPVITIIHNNAAWGIIQFGFQKAGFAIGADAGSGTSLEGTDYAAIAVGFGCHGEVVERIEEFGPALNRAVASGLPSVIDCRVQFMPHPSLSHFVRMSSAGAV